MLVRMEPLAGQEMEGVLALTGLTLGTIFPMYG